MAGSVGTFVAAIALLAACSTGDDASTETTAATLPATTDQPTSPVVTAVLDEPAPTATTARPATSTTTIPLVPDTGVPGLESGDPFCQAWSEFGGSFQALALASSFAADPATARPCAVAAAPALIAATDTIAGELPAELEGERTALVEGLLGPLRRRAERNVDALRAAGVDDEQLAVLATAWLDALATAGTDDPDIDVDLPDGLATTVDEVAAQLAGEVPPISEDPSLITDAAIPQTEAYLVANCPDRGTLAGNDVVDG